VCVSQRAARKSGLPAFFWVAAWYQSRDACDLMIALSFLPADVRPEFQAAYGAIDESTWRLAR